MILYEIERRTVPATTTNDTIVTMDRTISQVVEGSHMAESAGEQVMTLSWSHHRKRAEAVGITVEASRTLDPESWRTLTAPIEILSTSGALETLRMVIPVLLPDVPQEFYRVRGTMVP